MAHKNGVPLAVLTPRQEHVEQVNSALRDAGHPAHCLWVRNREELETALAAEPELILQVLEYEVADISPVVALLRRHAHPVPLILIGREADEASIATAMRSGARDLVTFDQRDRLQAVLERELHGYRTERALNATLETATQYRRQLRAYMNQLSAAIAYVQEGIVVEVNPAWTELFGAGEDSEIVGMPLMDRFASASHGPLKGALVAASRDKWNDDTVQARAVTCQDAEIAVDVRLRRTEHDGEPAIELTVTPSAPEERDAREVMERVMTADSTTGLLARQPFVEALETRLAEPIDAGVRVLAWIKPDRFSDTRATVGIFRSEDTLAELAALLREELTETELAGRFEGTSFLALLERGSESDARRWAERLLEKIRSRCFLAEESPVALTCTIGLCPATSMLREPGQLITGAAEAMSHGRDTGGDTVRMNQTADNDTLIRRNDAIWVRLLKSALMENRFRLLQLPIASLDGQQRGMFDILIRMLDEQGNRLLPAEFLPVAERNNLMKVIDRWIIGASCELAAASGARQLFVRLSRHSVADETLLPWLEERFRTTGARPGQLCFQLGEEEAVRYLHRFAAMMERLRGLGCRFALEHAGAGERTRALIERVQPDFVKIDGSLIHSLARDQELQHQVQSLVERMREIGIHSIAERVEDANTMAVLWQLGVSYMQGHYVHEPEVVLQESA